MCFVLPEERQKTFLDWSLHTTPFSPAQEDAPLYSAFSNVAAQQHEENDWYLLPALRGYFLRSAMAFQPLTVVPCSVKGWSS